MFLAKNKVHFENVEKAALLNSFFHEFFTTGEISQQSLVVNSQIFEWSKKKKDWKYHIILFLFSSHVAGAICTM